MVEGEAGEERRSRRGGRREGRGGEGGWRRQAGWAGGKGNDRLYQVLVKYDHGGCWELVDSISEPRTVSSLKGIGEQSLEWVLVQALASLEGLIETITERRLSVCREVGCSDPDRNSGENERRQRQLTFVEQQKNMKIERNQATSDKTRTRIYIPGNIYIYIYIYKYVTSERAANYKQLNTKQQNQTTGKKTNIPATSNERKTS